MKALLQSSALMALLLAALGAAGCGNDEVGTRRGGAVATLDGDPVAGIIGRARDVPAEVPDSWSVYFTVADCTATQSRAVQLGGSVILPATPTPMGPFAVLADPAGAAFQVMEMTSPSSPSGR